MPFRARMPDAVFTAHVHNYQRFTRAVDGRQVPYLVVGDGGYHNLHRVSRSVQDYPHDPPFAIPTADGVTFETYCDDRYGYLRLDVTRDAIRGDFFTVAGRGETGDEQLAHLDAWTLDLTAHTVRTEATGGHVANGQSPTPRPPRRRTPRVTS